MINTSCESLNARFALPGLLSFEEGQGGLPVAVINNSHAKTEISVYAAHVMSFTPHNEKDVLWMSEKSYFESGKPIRGGIPICWPWFGAHPTDTDKPSHGFARTFMWDLIATEDLGDSTSLVLGLSDTEETRALWPYPFKLEYTVKVGKKLEAELTVCNTGDSDFSCTSALHSYFNVSDIEDVTVQGLEDCAYIDTVGGGSVDKVQKGLIDFTEETDRIYLDTASECIISDPGYKRSVSVSKEGSNSTVVWNPWIDKAARMPDFGDEEYHGMLCVETTNARSDAVTVPAGGCHKLEAVITLV